MNRKEASYARSGIVLMIFIGLLFLGATVPHTAWGGLILVSFVSGCCACWEAVGFGEARYYRKNPADLTRPAYIPAKPRRWSWAGWAAVHTETAFADWRDKHGTGITSFGPYHKDNPDVPSVLIEYGDGCLALIYGQPNRADAKVVETRIAVKQCDTCRTKISQPLVPFSRFIPSGWRVDAAAGVLPGPHKLGVWYNMAKPDDQAPGENREAV